MEINRLITRLYILESYGVVEKMAKKIGVPVGSIVGNGSLVQKLRPEEFVNEQFGLPTVVDIIEELGEARSRPEKRNSTLSAFLKTPKPSKI
jgi:uncharacterized protein